ncbi:MAG: hypothetical protein HOV80_23820, partial [Polyangiaceae bacterium]|nr:hypothetical protein [Polyangiaceae bacterium]
MRYAHLLLLCLVLAPACDDETAVGPLNVPEPRTRSELVVCTDQPQLGDTWELPFEADRIQLDAEGNVYLLG